MTRTSELSTNVIVPADKQIRDLAASELADVSGGFFGAFVARAFQMQSDMSSKWTRTQDAIAQNLK